MSQTLGQLLIVSGPSGVGKSTVCREVCRRTDAFLSVSCTTRQPGNGESDGVHYHFLSLDEFQRRIAEGRLIEYANVYGNYYGTPREPVEAAMQNGQTVILEIDVQGGLQVKRRYPQAKLIFVMPPDIDVLLERIEGRNRGEDAASKQRRLDTARSEIETARAQYDYLVVNDRLETAVDEVIRILENK